MRLIQYTLLILVVQSSTLFGESEYKPQHADMIKEKICWSRFPEISGRDVTCYTQDSSGTFWFGIGTEILSYDGINWKQYTGRHGLPSAYLQTLVTAPDGQIYGVFETDGVYTLSDSMWHQVITLRADSVTIFRDLIPVGSDSFWVATNQGAVFYQKDHCTLYKRYQKISIDANGKWESDIHSSTDWNIFSIYIDCNGHLWFVDMSDGNGKFIKIPRWKTNLGDRSRWKTFQASNRGISFGGLPKIFQASNGQYWIYTFTEMTGVYQFYDPEDQWHHVDFTELGGDNLVRSMIETNDGTVWFGSTGLLYAYRDQKFIIYDHSDLNIQIAPISMLQARDGALWLLSAHVDVHRIDYARQQWDIFENLHYQCSTQTGYSYFLTSDGRVVRRSPDVSSWQSFGSEDGLMDMPCTLLCTQEGEIWAAGSQQGIAAVSRMVDKKWITETFPELSWSVAYQSALQSQDGSIWFGSMSGQSASFRGGVIVYEKVNGDYRFQHYFSDKAPFNRIAVLTLTSDGRIWAGGTQLMYADGLTWTLLLKPKELQKAWIDFVLGTSDSSLWVAKGGVGIFLLKDHQWTKYTTKDALPDIIVTTLLELPNQNILAATRQGYSRFDGRSWVPFCLHPEINIPRESGTLKLDQENRLWINRAHRSWYFRALSPENQTYRNVFRTISYKGDTLAPNTEITFFQERLTTPANQYMTWKGADYWGSTSQEELVFSYRLDNSPWSVFTTDRSVQLLGVEDGIHRFEVRAMDRDGNVDPTPAKIFFEVIPSVWKQAWFWILVIFISTTVIGLIIGLSLQNRKLSAANLKIERIASFKERFFLNLSHEVRTPLTMILAPVSSLLSSKNRTWEQIKKQLETFQHHSYYLKRLIDQMFDFRKMELGKYRLQVSEGDIAQIVRETAELFCIFAEEHRIDYQIETNPSTILGCFDDEMIQIILMNLIGNAFKFTPDEGKIKVYLQYDLLNPEGNKEWICIRVEDNGIGIPANRLEHIFDRFYHVEHPGKLFYDSIGIGLDFTKEIIELHKGKILVESEFEKGSVFHVYLPIGKEAFLPDECVVQQTQIISPQLAQEKIEEIKEERTRLHRKEKIGEIQGDHHTENGRPKVLIVEDHPDMRDLLMQFLENNYDVLLAENGRLGIKLTLTEMPDLVISDIMMPEMDGFEMTKAIKSNMITSHIPVILLTVKSEIENRINGFETGADAYITKPFMCEELQVRVRKLIESRELLKKRFRSDVDIDPKEVTTNKLDESFLEKCITIIDEKITEPDFNVDQLCRNLGMSRTQAYKKVKSLSGFAINEFIIQIKLKRAAKMLIETSMYIGEIAHFLGFSDHPHMSRHFRNKFGCSPKKYREKHTA